MWQQFLREPWCRARTVGRPTAVSIDAYMRSILPPEGSAARMAQLRAKCADPAFVAELDRLVLASLNTQWTAGQLAKWNSEEALKKQAAAAAKSDAEQAETRRRIDAERAEAHSRIDADAIALAKARAQLAHVRAVLQHKRARYAEIKKSRSWRWTRPFRRLARKLAPRRDD